MEVSLNQQPFNLLKNRAKSLGATKSEISSAYLFAKPSERKKYIVDLIKDKEKIKPEKSLTSEDSLLSIELSRSGGSSIGSMDSDGWTKVKGSKGKKPNKTIIHGKGGDNEWSEDEEFEAAIADAKTLSKDVDPRLHGYVDIPEKSGYKKPNKKKSPPKKKPTKRKPPPKKKPSTKRKPPSKKKPSTKRKPPSKKKPNKRTKSNNDLKKFINLEKKLQKLYMKNTSYKEIDKVSRKLADLQKKLIKQKKK